MTNFGTLTGRTNDAVIMTSGGTVTNEPGGTIIGAAIGGSGGSDAIFITGATGTVLNEGLINQVALAGQVRNGVLLNPGGTLTNTEASGTITAQNYAFEAVTGAARVVNYGSIGATIAGLALKSGGQVFNESGAITGAVGVYVTGATGTVTNGATITGGGGDGVYLKAGGRVTNLGTGTTISGAGEGVQIAGAVGTVQNSGTIKGTIGGVVLSGGGYVNNLGTLRLISGGTVGVGIRGGAGTVVNYATIRATGTAIGSAGIGVEFYDSTGTVKNGGLISGKYAAVALDAGGVVTNLAGGTLGGGDDGAYFGLGGGVGTMINAGTASGTAAGVYLELGGRVTNLGTGATISGGVYGVGVSLGRGTVQNSGSITGGVAGVNLHRGGYVNNIGAARVISGGTNGVYGRGGSTTVVNLGTITATLAAGVGVRFTDNVGLFNNTVTNAGTIAGGASGKAVQFAGGNDLMVIDPGAVFTGAVDGGAGINTLEFAKGASAGSFTGLGSTSFANFRRVKVDACAAWTFTGTNVLGAGVTLTNSGAMTLAGTSIFTGTETNYGTISGTMTIISPRAAGPLVNEAAATITSVGEAIYGAFKAWSLTNAGTISGGTDAIHLVAAGGVISNLGAALITGSGNGVFLANGVTVVYSGATSWIVATAYGVAYGVDSKAGYAMVSNAGTIVSNAADPSRYFPQPPTDPYKPMTKGMGVDLFSGSVNNSGVIQATGFKGIGVDIGTGALVNAGTIEAANFVGQGAAVGSGNVTNQSGGTITGGFLGLSVGGGGTVTNGGVISGTSAGVLQLKAPGGGYFGYGVVGVGLFLTGGGTVTNEAGASITGPGGGLDIGSGPGVVTNAGYISGMTLASGGSVTNQGTGLIRGSFYGVVLTANGVVANQDATSTISGDLFGVLGVNGVDTLTNDGTIESLGTNGTGVSIEAGLVANLSGGTIAGVKYGVQINGFSGAATLINAGIIKASGKAGVAVGAGPDAHSVTVTTSGTISGGASGKAIQFGTANDLLVIDPGAVFKGSVISSMVDGGAGADIVELAAGTIFGHFSGLGSAFTNFETVDVDAGASWIFSGLNTVGTGVVLDVMGTLTNSGDYRGDGHAHRLRRQAAEQRRQHHRRYLRRRAGSGRGGGLGPQPGDDHRPGRQRHLSARRGAHPEHRRRRQHHRRVQRRLRRGWRGNPDQLRPDRGIWRQLLRRRRPGGGRNDHQPGRRRDHRGLQGRGGVWGGLAHQQRNYHRRSELRRHLRRRRKPDQLWGRKDFGGGDRRGHRGRRRNHSQLGDRRRHGGERGNHRQHRGQRGGRNPAGVRRLDHRHDGRRPDRRLRYRRPDGRGGRHGPQLRRNHRSHRRAHRVFVSDLRRRGRRDDGRRNARQFGRRDHYRPAVWRPHRWGGRCGDQRRAHRRQREPSGLEHRGVGDQGRQQGRRNDHRQLRRGVREA